jgi:hypothetical protein
VTIQAILDQVMELEEHAQPMPRRPIRERPVVEVRSPLLCGTVATSSVEQSVARQAHNLEVTGSNPVAATEP